MGSGGLTARPLSYAGAETDDDSATLSQRAAAQGSPPPLTAERARLVCLTASRSFAAPADRLLVAESPSAPGLPVLAP